MKIGIFMYSLSGGGAERQFLYVLNHCIERNIDVNLILMNSTIKYELPKKLKVYYIEKSSASENGILKALKIPFLAYKYSSLIKKLELTHSISLLTRPNFINIIAKSLSSYKFKLIINELAFPSLEYGYNDFQSFFNKLMIKYLYRKSDLIICNSYGNANDLIDNFNVDKEKTKVVQNPIDLEKIKKVKEKKDFFDPNKFNIITVGRLDHGKNHSMLIDAFFKLRNESIRLYIFGDGILREKLAKKINDLGLKKQIYLMGFDPNPFKYLKAADLFIFGSNHEGFPNVVLEAMACGLPILTTNCQSGPAEIMELNQSKDDIMITQYGILVPTKNTDLMKKGIEYFINNKIFAENCIKNGLKRIRDFEKNKILNKYVKTFTSVNATANHY